MTRQRGYTASARRRSSGSGGGTITNLPSQPSAVMYDAVTGMSQYNQPGAMVIAGRDNYANQAFKDVSAAGGHVLIYLDTIVLNTGGTYHNLLFSSSVYGAAVPEWPGGPWTANSTGNLSDFRTAADGGGILQSKLAGVMEQMVSDNPHISGFFMDDLGSRSWFPNLNWTNFPDKTQYRNGAIGICQTARQVCDNHGLWFMVNGTWEATSTNGGGYPDINTHGNSLADGGCVEHHDSDGLGFWGPAYDDTTQWATGSPLTNGKAFHLAIMATSAGVTTWANANEFAYITLQSDYTSGAPTPWTSSFHVTGLPTAVPF